MSNPDPTEGLTLTETFAPGSSIGFNTSGGIAGQMDRNNDVVMSFDITMPTGTADGGLFHGGAAGDGAGVWFDSGRLIARWGQGSTNTALQVSAQETELNFATEESATITVEFSVTLNTIRIWKNNDLVPLTYIQQGESTVWCGTAGGGYGTADGNTMTGTPAQPAAVFNGTFDSGLRYYENQLSTWEEGPGGAITGTLAAQETGSDTFSATGAIAITGALTAQETGADTFSGSGTVEDPTVTGTLAAQEAGADTFSGSGAVEGVVVTGTLTAQEAGNDNFTGLGFIDITGTMAAQETGVDVFAGIGSIPQVRLNTARIARSPMRRRIGRR